MQQALNATQFDIVFVAERKALIGGEKVRRGTKNILQKKYEMKQLLLGKTKLSLGRLRPITSCDLISFNGSTIVGQFKLEIEPLHFDDSVGQLEQIDVYSMRRFDRVKNDSVKEIKF